MTGAERFALFLDSFASLDYRRKRAIFALLKGEADPFDRLAGMRAELCACAGEREAGALLSAARGGYADEIAERLNGRGIVPVACVSPAYPALLKETARRRSSSMRGAICPAVFPLFCGGRQQKEPPVRPGEGGGICGSPDPARLHRRDGDRRGRRQRRFACGAVLRKGDICHRRADSTAYIRRRTRLSSGRCRKGGWRCPSIRPPCGRWRITSRCAIRIIAGLSEGVLVVSGDEKSGTAYTAGYAADYGREVFALPYQPGIPSGRGCNRLIKNGAYLTDCIEDILSVYHIEKKERNEPALSELEQSLLALIADGVSHAERLAERAGRPVYEIMPALMQLEIKKKIVRGAGNTYAAS